MSRRFNQTPEQRQAKLDYQRKYRKENRQIVLERGRKCERRRKFKRYGITEDIYNKMLETQKYACAICKTTDSGTRDWHIDHCHTTLIVRGILCHRCNILLGHAKDNPEILKQAIQYLKASQ